MTTRRSSDEGAAAPAVAEKQPLALVPKPSEAPEAETPPAAPPAPPPSPVDAGLPSPHQNHSLNWMTEVQIKYDTFKAGHDALVAELEGKDRDFAAEQADSERKHGDVRAGLLARIRDMQIGMETSICAVDRYNQLVAPGPSPDNGEDSE